MNALVVRIDKITEHKGWYGLRIGHIYDEDEETTPKLSTSIYRVNLKRIASGKKRVEYRQVKPYWTKRLEKLETPFQMRLFVKTGRVSKARTGPGSRGGSVGRTRTGKVKYLNPGRILRTGRVYRMAKLDYETAMLEYGSLSPVTKKAKVFMQSAVKKYRGAKGYKQIMKGTKGEGTRGGKVIDRTKSGKPIYASGKKHGNKKQWTSADHYHAASAHYRESARLAEEIIRIRSKPEMADTVAKYTKQKKFHGKQGLKHYEKYQTGGKKVKKATGDGMSRVDAVVRLMKAGGAGGEKSRYSTNGGPRYVGKKTIRPGSTKKNRSRIKDTKPRVPKKVRKGSRVALVMNLMKAYETPAPKSLTNDEAASYLWACILDSMRDTARWWRPRHSQIQANAELGGHDELLLPEHPDYDAVRKQAIESTFTWIQRQKATDKFILQACRKKDPTTEDLAAFWISHLAPKAA